MFIYNTKDLAVNHVDGDTYHIIVKDDDGKEAKTIRMPKEAMYWFAKSIADELNKGSGLYCYV